MGFISKMFGTREANWPVGWKELKDLEQLNSIWEESRKHPVALFKHSTRCSVSFMAKQRLEQAWDMESDSCSFYFLDLIAHRDVSNAIAEKSGVTHQSPQLIVIHNGQVVYDASHGEIDYDVMLDMIKA